jgi:mono/diheme cytochrome c family protein
VKPILSACLFATLFASCDPGPKSAHGFRLPDGDPRAGRAAFEELGCIGCHTVEGTDIEGSAPGKLDVRLGGKVLRVRSYGELVTAIILPSHDLAKGYDPQQVSREGESLMAVFNDTMTVQQLIDLVAFLQPAYVEYLPKDYDPYFP